MGIEVIFCGLQSCFEYRVCFDRFTQERGVEHLKSDTDRRYAHAGKFEHTPAGPAFREDAKRLPEIVRHTLKAKFRNAQIGKAHFSAMGTEAM